MLSISFQFYGYLNPESTKTSAQGKRLRRWFYGYLNPESTKTSAQGKRLRRWFYGYLNPESTKTLQSHGVRLIGFTVT